MKLSIISFTENGMRLSKRIAEVFPEADPALFSKHRDSADGDLRVRFVESSVGEWAGAQMRERNALLFIGACGIAVRAVAPYLTDKLHDSPVLVMDERGKFIIPILSGHVGGANELALVLAEKTGAGPVITTATDIHGTFAVDVFAKKNSLWIENKEGIARVSSRALAGKPVRISVEPGHLDMEEEPPEEVLLLPYPPGLPVDAAVVSSKEGIDAALFLRPKEYVIGMGCKKGKEPDLVEALIRQTLDALHISRGQIFALASITQKKEEPGLVLWCRKEGVPFFTYTAEELKGVQGGFQHSSFVKEKMGVDNVCERAAVKACGPGGKLVYGKCARDGMTIAVAKREWKVTFHEK